MEHLGFGVTMAMLLICMVVLMLMGGCTTRYEAQEIDTALEVKGQTHDKKLGLNDDRQIILQKEERADRELDTQQMVNIRLQDELGNYLAELQYCRETLANPEFGGSGDVKDLPAIDNMRDPVEVRESIGITDEGDLKVVKKEFFAERLKAEREFDKALRKMTRLAKSHLRSCNRKARYRLKRLGLPEDWRFDIGRTL